MLDNLLILYHARIVLLQVLDENESQFCPLRFPFELFLPLAELNFKPQPLGYFDTPPVPLSVLCRYFNEKQVFELRTTAEPCGLHIKIAEKLVHLLFTVDLLVSHEPHIELLHHLKSFPLLI